MQATKVKGLEHFSYSEMLSELELFGTEKAQEDLMYIYVCVCICMYVYV